MKKKLVDTWKRKEEDGFFNKYLEIQPVCSFKPAYICIILFAQLLILAKCLTKCEWFHEKHFNEKYKTMYFLIRRYSLWKVIFTFFPFNLNFSIFMDVVWNNNIGFHIVSHYGVRSLMRISRSSQRKQY